MPELVTLAPGVEIPAPEPGVEVRYSRDAVQDVTDFFSLLVFGQNEWAGKPFTLLPWEEDAIRQFYGVQTRDDSGDWVRYRRYLYTEIGKKNGKSEFAAGLGLYHLLYDGESLPKVGIFAADKENAGIIYDAAKYMVENTCLGQPERDPIAWAVDSKKEIRTKMGGVLKVYSSEAESKHGYSFSCVIFDELHAQPNRRLWDVVTFGSDSARRQQAVIVLTTAGDDPDRKSIGWEIHEKCRRFLAWRAGAPERELDDDDPQWCPIMYGISVLTGDDPDKIAELDIYDEALWRLCNPSLGITVPLRTLRAEARAAKKSEAAEKLFRWLRLNQWIAVHAVGWIPLTIYDKTQWNDADGVRIRRDQAVELLRGKRCFGGLDLSTTTDLTAFVLLFPPQPGLEHWVVVFWGAWIPGDDMTEREQRDHVPFRDWIRAGFLSESPGNIIDYDQVEAAIFEAAREFKMTSMGVDPHLSRTITPRLMKGKEGYPALDVVEIPQDVKNLSPAMKEIERLIRLHKMRHEHNTCARWNFGNVRCYVDGNENMKPMKNRSIGRIDITVAWIIAMATAQLHPDPGYDKENLEEDWSL
ncbi:hypothetical protein SDC9_79087 [bioreactor metagenome]|uniref:Terminase large subunit n=1 Tax=bioreactor metagenome TaxID=1076179 RepID=A0A644Z304_9ZZZZ